MSRTPLSPRNHLIAVGVLILYGALSAWIVRGLGQSHRRSLLAQATTPANPSSSTPTPTLEPVLQTSESPASTSKPTPEPIPQPEPTPVVVAEVKPLQPSASPLIKTEPSPPPPVLDPFWDGPQQQKVWNLARMTVEDERSLGATLNQAIRKFHHPMTAGPLPERLERAARPFLDARERKNIEYKLTVLDCDQVNAFSHPGGYIYVCRGLFDLISEDEDTALEFVVGHEVAHVDKAHAIICLRDPSLPKDVGTSLLFCSLILPLGYINEQDLDADRWSSQIMARSGRSKHETLKFLRKLESYAQDHGFGNVRMKPNDDPPVDLIDNHLRSHLIPRERLKALQATWSPAPKPK